MREMVKDMTHNILNGLGKTLAVLLISMCVLTVASAQSVLTDDAHTSSVLKDIDSNFGANPNVMVSLTNKAYLKFKLTPTVPVGTQGSDVSKATLKVYVGNVSTPGMIDVFQLAENWNEKNLTARN